MALKKLEVEGRTFEPLFVENLASLTTLSSLTLSGARAEGDKLPASIVDLTFAGPAIEEEDTPDLPVLETLTDFPGQLLSLSLDPSAVAALHFGLSEISALQSLSRLRCLTLSIRGQQSYGQEVSQACLPGLQTLVLILFSDEVPLWDFSLCPVLCRLGIHVGLSGGSNPMAKKSHKPACLGCRRSSSSYLVTRCHCGTSAFVQFCRLGIHVGLTSSDGSCVLDLTNLTGLRARQLALEVRSDHVISTVSNFADWGLISASIIIKDITGSMVPCRGCRVGRELLGSLFLELPKHLVQEDCCVMVKIVGW